MKRQYVALSALLIGGAPLKMAWAAPGYECLSSPHMGADPDPSASRIESGTKPEGASWDINTHIGATAPQVVEMAGTVNAKAYGLPGVPGVPSSADVSASDYRWASSVNTWQWNPDGTSAPPSAYSASITSLNGGQISASFTSPEGGYRYGSASAEGKWQGSSSALTAPTRVTETASAPGGAPSADMHHQTTQVVHGRPGDWYISEDVTLHANWNASAYVWGYPSAPSASATSLHYGSMDVEISPVR